MSAEDYEVRWVGQHAVIRMPAEIDAANADEIRQALLAAVTPGTAILIIDMGATTFCDSAGLKSIIAAHARAVETGTQLRLVATAVLRIITIVGIDQLIPIYPTLEAALTGTPQVEALTERLAGTSRDLPREEPPPGADAPG